jgi:hypothetical protein
MAEYLRFRGKVMVAPAMTMADLDLDAKTNIADPMRWVGNSVDFELKLSSERFKHQEMWSGKDATDVSQVDSLGGSMSATMEEPKVENYRISVFGEPFISDSGSVTGAYLAKKNAAGKWVKNGGTLPALNTYLPILKTQNPFTKYTYIADSTLVITDSTAVTPKTLTVGVNYVLHPDFMTNGLIKFIDLTTGGVFTGPLRCAFSAGSFTDTFSQPLGFGNPYALTHPNISSLVLKDSAGTPVTVDTAYYDLDADFGELTLLEAQESAFYAENYVLPLRATYTFAPSTNIPILAAQPANQFVRLRGIDKLSKRKVIVDLYNVSLDPASATKWLTKDLTTLPLAGELVEDLTRPEDNILGRFGRIVTW